MTSLWKAVLAVAVLFVVVGAFVAGATIFPRVQQTTRTVTIFTNRSGNQVTIPAHGQIEQSPRSGYIVYSDSGVNNLTLKIQNWAASNPTLKDTIYLLNPKPQTLTFVFPALYYRNWLIWDNSKVVPNPSFANITSGYLVTTVYFYSAFVNAGNITLELDWK